MITRRQLLAALAFGASGLATRRAAAFGPSSAFDMPIVRYNAPGWNPRPNATRRLLLEIEMRTSIQVARDTAVVEPTREALAGCPMAVVAGDRAFDPWPDTARAALGLFLSAGGTLLVDSAEGRLDGGFAESIRRELAAALPGRSFAPLSREHVVYKAFYLVPGATGRLAVAPEMEGISFDGRTAVFLSHNDLLGAWARDNLGNWEYEVRPGGDTQREMAFRLGVNLAMYALCLDYKEDQVHVPFILRRRQWRVD